MGLWMEKVKTAFTGLFVLGLMLCLGGCALDSSFLENLGGSAEAEIGRASCRERV